LRDKCPGPLSNHPAVLYVQITPAEDCTQGLRDTIALPLTREVPVPSFRAYPISNNRKVAASAPVVIDCENDEDGIRQAQQLVSDNDIELWDGPRFIARLKSSHGSKDSH
jgi:hypothetical protein